MSEHAIFFLPGRILPIVAAAVISTTGCGTDAHRTPSITTQTIRIDGDLTTAKIPKSKDGVAPLLMRAYAGEPDAAVLLWRLLTGPLTPESKRDYPGALLFLEKAIAKHPDHAVLNLGMGDAYLGKPGVKGDP